MLTCSNMSDSRDSSILHLPPNVFLMILRFLDLKSLTLTTRVCRLWHSYGNDPSLWKIIDLTPYKLNLRTLKKIINRRISKNTHELRIKGHITATKKLDNLSNSLLSDISQNAPNLCNLTLSQCDLKNIDIKLLPCNLRSLCLSQSLLPLGWFEALKTENVLPFIEELDVNACSRISSEDITSICRLKSLKILNLGSCYRITDYDIKSIASSLPDIIHLDISSCLKLTNESLQHIARCLKNLTKLHIQNCHLVTAVGLAALQDGLTKLELINVVGCNKTMQEEALTMFSVGEKFVVENNINV